MRKISDLSRKQSKHIVTCLYHIRIVWFSFEVFVPNWNFQYKPCCSQCKLDLEVGEELSVITDTNYFIYKPKVENNLMYLFLIK